MINEKYIEKSLKLFLHDRKNLNILVGQKKLPLPKGGFKSCKPDIIASTKRGEKLYIIECKKGSNLRSIGHAFGQLYVDDLVIRRIKQKDWITFVKEITNSNISRKPDLIFGVAFHIDVQKDKNAKKVIKEFTKKFERYRVSLVKNKDYVNQKKNLV